MTEKKDNQQQSGLASIAVAGSGVGGIGCTIPLFILIAIFGGQKLDAMLGTSPFILLTLLLVSIIAGLAMMISSAFSAAKAAERQYFAKHQSVRGDPDDPHEYYGEDHS